MNDVALPTHDQARALTDRIKVAVEGTWLLIQEAYTSRSWAVLGYDSWDAYCTAEFGTARLQLPREERQEVVASLRESGLSTRAIGSATGVSHTQVRKDLNAAGGNRPCENAGQGAEEFPPGVVTGTDGKAYAASHADLQPNVWVQPDEPKFEAMVTPPQPPKAKRRPLPEAFADASRDLSRAAERLARLTEDDRFPKNRDTTHHQVPELLGALDHTTRLITAMNLPAAETSEEARRWWATSLNNLSDTLRGVANSLEQENRNA